jgi:hypothetical protein
MSINSIRATLDGFDTATLTANYQAVNPNGFVGAPMIIRLINNSANSIDVSYDGLNDDDVLRPNTDVTLNFQSNAAPNNYVAKFPKGTVVYVKSSASAAGEFAVVIYYQPTN